MPRPDASRNLRRRHRTAGLGPRGRRTPAVAAWTGVALISLATVAACSGGSRPTSPTQPTPAPVPPASPACAAISSGLGPSLGIVNGSPCSSVDSSVVLVHRRDEAGRPLGACSGTVIAPRAVLTAGHCIRSGVAAVDIDPGSGAWVTAVSFTPYPNPFGVISLDAGIVLTGDDLPRAPVPILTSRDARVGESAVIAGWGLDGTGIGQVLRAGMAEVTRVGVGELRTEYIPGGAGSGGCAGDSGGPLLLQEGGAWAVAAVFVAMSQKDNCSAAATSDYAKLATEEIQAFVMEHVPDVQRR